MKFIFHREHIHPKVFASYDPNLHEYNSAPCIINSLNFILSENQFLFRPQFSENRISKTKKCHQ